MLGSTSAPGRPVGPDVSCRLSQRAERLRGRRDDPIALKFVYPLDPGDHHLVVSGAHLRPGHYVLICDIPGHYQKGMRRDFTLR